ncbi:MAG: flagellar basal body rod protein FlgC [Planctomycetes bacterium GWF2_42_9]|nr:MAG: flagellar basal body rod protein FlgC [Planctomycetes bacterium GWF2_42_9]
MGENSIGSMDIAISGMRAQSRNIEVLSSNVANAQSTDNGNGQPYRRLEAVMRSNGEGIGGVTTEDIIGDMSEFPSVFKPGNPNADENGYVKMPNVNLPVEMMNLNMAAKAYQANTAVLKRYQDMVNTTLELLK